MHLNEYVAEKLRQLESERTDSVLRMRMAKLVESNNKPTSRLVIGPVLRVAGRTLRRAGEGLEGWGSRELDRERKLRAERRTG